MRAADVSQIQPQACDAMLQVPLAEPRRPRLPLGKQRDELRRLPLSLVEALERGGNGRIGGAKGAELLQVSDRAVRIAGQIASCQRCFVEQVRALRIVGSARDGPVVEAKELGPPDAG